MKHALRITIALALVAATNAWSAGFEKAVLWSGKYAAIGGAASSVVAGSQSLYFNPAGLASGSGTEFSGNFSPTFSKFKGPFTTEGVQREGETQFSPVFGVTASHKLTEKLGFGIGTYVSGGTTSEYKAVPLNGLPAAGSAIDNLTPDSKVNVSITEIALGAGYELTESLKIGAAYRVTLVKAEVNSIRYSASPVGNITSADFTDLKDEDFGGFKLGAQWAPKDAGFGLGAVFRSGIIFSAKGKVSGRNESIATPPSTLTPSESASLTNRFPLQTALGGFYDVSPNQWRMIGEWTFTRYAVNREIVVGGTLNTAQLPNLAQNWKNQHNFRVATEYMLSPEMPLRLGYVYTTQVTPDNRARPGFASPGIGHTITTGVGKSFSANLDVDLGLEYSFASGTGTNPDLNGRGGKFSTNSKAAHLGVTYRL